MVPWIPSPKVEIDEGTTTGAWTLSPSFRTRCRKATALAALTKRRGRHPDKAVSGLRYAYIYTTHRRAGCTGNSCRAPCSEHSGPSPAPQLPSRYATVCRGRTHSAILGPTAISARRRS